jgi:glycosyltransferase involved in cell wall biosynthesis
MKSNFTILQVNSYDIAGGAEVIATNLFYGYLKRGYRSYLLVGMKKGSDPLIQEIEMGHSPNPWERYWMTKQGKYKRTKDMSKISWWKYYFTKFFAHPTDALNLLSGIPDFNFPATRDITGLVPEPPDILHLHTLHGDYFDLRELPRISHEIPVVMTIHDTWITGQFYKNSPVPFPDSHIKKVYLKNYRQNAKILGGCQLHIITPSKWMMDLAGTSLLKPAIRNHEVIPNGIDLSVFHPYDKTKAREELGISDTSKILVFSANAIRQNVSKDYDTLHNALRIVADRQPDTNIVFYAIGESSSPERMGNAEIRFVPFFSNPQTMAKYYQAADIYIHAARVDNFPTTILESLACGTPVVATAVGGIPEQVTDGFNGFLTKPADPLDMADKIELLLDNDTLRERMAQNAVKDARARFDMNVQIERYLTFYQKILVDTG